VGLFYGDLFASWEIAVAKSLIIKFQKNYPWLKGFEFENLSLTSKWAAMGRPNETGCEIGQNRKIIDPQTGSGTVVTGDPAIS